MNRQRFSLVSFIFSRSRLEFAKTGSGVALVGAAFDLVILATCSYWISGTLSSVVRYDGYFTLPRLTQQHAFDCERFPVRPFLLVRPQPSLSEEIFERTLSDVCEPVEFELMRVEEHFLAGGEFVVDNGEGLEIATKVGMADSLVDARVVVFSSCYGYLDCVSPK